MYIFLPLYPLWLYMKESFFYCFPLTCVRAWKKLLSRAKKSFLSLKDICFAAWTGFGDLSGSDFEFRPENVGKSEIGKKAATDRDCLGFNFASLERSFYVKLILLIEGSYHWKCDTSNSTSMYLLTVYSGKQLYRNWIWCKLLICTLL